MTTPPSLPSLAGLAWSRHKKPGFSTRVASHVSGREVRVALMSYPLYEFEAVYNGLASNATAAFAGLGSSSLQSLMGFFLQLQGQFGTFLYTDPDDNAVTGQAFATGDGATTVVHNHADAWRIPRAGRLGDQLRQRLSQRRRAIRSGYSLTTPNTLTFHHGAGPAASRSRPTSPTPSTAAFSTTRWISRSSCRTCGNSTA